MGANGLQLVRLTVNILDSLTVKVKVLSVKLSLTFCRSFLCFELRIGILAFLATKTYA